MILLFIYLFFFFFTLFLKLLRSCRSVRSTYLCIVFAQCPNTHIELLAFRRRRYCNRVALRQFLRERIINSPQYILRRQQIRVGFQTTNLPFYYGCCCHYYYRHYYNSRFLYTSVRDQHSVPKLYNRVFCFFAET